MIRNGVRGYSTDVLKSKLRDPSLFRQHAFVGGKWLDGQAGKTFAVYDPYSGNKIGTCPEM